MAYRNKQGKILNEWTGKKLSQYPNHFGVFSSASNQSDQTVLEQGRKLVETMNLFGICEPEFKYDSRDGTYKLTEVNLRSMMWNRMGNLSGVNLQYTQYLDAIGQATERQQQDQTRKIHYVYSKHEIFGLLNGTIPFQTFWHNLFDSDKTYFAVFDPQDIKPFLADSVANVRGLFRKMGESGFLSSWMNRNGWKRKGHA
ncbi:UNVERIFIED_CONTAM: putative ATP-grasp superfamily ATP-dependent carboligase [Brevibacillus sp. OAP136]